MTAPDRTGDREQQQAAEVDAAKAVLDAWHEQDGPDAGMDPATAGRDLWHLRTLIASALARKSSYDGARIAMAVQRAYQRGRGDGITIGRAEESARWQAKIEALADSLETDYKRTKFDDGALLACDRLRAVLDGEQ